VELGAADDANLATVAVSARRPPGKSSVESQVALAVHRQEMGEGASREHGSNDPTRSRAVRGAYGADPDLDVFAKLFVPPVAHESLATSGDELGVHRIDVGGVVVRYVESHMSIKLVVEGMLPEPTTATLVDDLREKLSMIEHTPYEAREV
jgi:hypothetical protein